MAEHFKTAKSIYATIIENDPGYNLAYLALATLQFQEGRQQEAVETLTHGASVVEEWAGAGNIAGPMVGGMASTAFGPVTMFAGTAAIALATAVVLRPRAIRERASNEAYA